jgi:hypothetical protein
MSAYLHKLSQAAGWGYATFRSTILGGMVVLNLSGQPQ